MSFAEIFKTMHWLVKLHVVAPETIQSNTYINRQGRVPSVRVLCLHNLLYPSAPWLVTPKPTWAPHSFSLSPHHFQLHPFLYFSLLCSIFLHTTDCPVPVPPTQPPSLKSSLCEKKTTHSLSELPLPAAGEAASCCDDQPSTISLIPSKKSLLYPSWRTQVTVYHDLDVFPSHIRVHVQRNRTCWNHWNTVICDLTFYLKPI